MNAKHSKLVRQVCRSYNLPREMADGLAKRIKKDIPKGLPKSDIVDYVVQVFQQLEESSKRSLEGMDKSDQT